MIVVISGILLCTGTYWAFTFGSYYPTPTTQSVFFQQAVAIPFAPHPQATSASAGASAGRRFVTNKRTFGMIFAVQPEKVPLLLTAASHDMLLRLTSDRAMDLNQTGDSANGFHINYRLGQILGTVILAGQPADQFVPRYVQTRLPVLPPEGTKYVSTVITISEHWFPNEALAIEAEKEMH